MTKNPCDPPAGGGSGSFTPEQPQLTARFHGGPLDGQVHALPAGSPPPPMLEVPLPPRFNYSAAVAASHPSLLPMSVTIETERYYAHRVDQPVSNAADRRLWDNPGYLTRAEYTRTYEYFTHAAAVLANTAASMEQFTQLMQTSLLTVNEARNLMGVTGGNNYAYQMTAGETFESVYDRTPAPLTDEQRARAALRVRRAGRRKEMAHKRARTLLLNLLSDEQQHEYAASQSFTVLAKNGKVFRLRKGKTSELLGADGSPVAAYCVHLAYGYEPEDTLAALLLTLQNDPAEFERTANITQLVRRTPPTPVDELAQARLDARRRADYVRESRAMLAREGLSEAEIDALQDWPNRASGLLVAA